MPQNRMVRLRGSTQIKRMKWKWIGHSFRMNPISKKRGFLSSA